jgi:hypothetical protein
MERVCFLHIGTHKTGTTSLQTFLAANEQCLERNGIFVPSSGRAWPGSGNHNLAWELSGDPRFDPALGSWRDVLGEIRSRNPPAVCLSSEDFVHLQRTPDSLCRIRQELNSIGYQVRIVVYLRPQADYIESLYAELVKDRSHIAFRKYLGEIFSSGAFSLGGPWTCPFDYGELLDSFAKAFRADRMVVHPYRANRRAKYLIDDLISVISPRRKIRGLDFSACRERLNPSLNFAQVVELRLANRRKSGEGNCEPSILDGHFMQGRFDPLDLRDLMRIHRRFREANRVLREKYQVRIATMTSRRLLRELICSAGLNRGSARRKDLLVQLDTMNCREFAVNGCA